MNDVNNSCLAMGGKTTENFSEVPPEIFSVVPPPTVKNHHLKLDRCMLVYMLV